MTPAATKRPSAKKKGRRENVKRTEWSVRGKGKAETGEGFGNSYAKVKIAGERIEITWLDGTSCATRAFSPHDLKELILLIDGPAKRYPDLWFRSLATHTTYSGSRQFYFQLGEDGRLTANTSPLFHGSVDWADLKHGFEEALSELDSDEEEADEA